MKRTAAYSVADNEADALVLADMLSKLDALPKPTIALQSPYASKARGMM